MAITSNVVVTEGVGNGVATNFPTGYLIYSKDDVQVKLDGVVQTEGTHYTVTGLGTEAVQVEFVSPPDTDVVILLIKNVPYTQEIDFIQYNKFSADAVEKALDTTTILSQQTLNELKKTPKAPSTVTSAFDGEMASFISSGIVRGKADNTGFYMVSTSEFALELSLAAIEVSASLLSLGNLGTAADKFPYTTAANTWAEGDITAFGRSLLDDAAAVNARTTLGLTIGTDVQAQNAGLQDIAGLNTADGNIIVGYGPNWVAESGATARTSLGLGTTDDVSFLNGDFSGTEALKIPVGTTAERPSVPAEGDMRLNTSLNTTEVYRDADWRDIEAATTGTGVIQVQSFTFDNVFSTTNTTWTDTGIEIAITPTATTSKVFVICSASGSCSSSSYYVQYRLVRDSTAIGVGATAGSRTLVSGTTAYGATRPSHPMSVSYYDSPNTTSTTTYKLQISNMSGSSTTVYINRSPTDTDNAAYPRAASTITVMEIGE